jgi:O-Antigen ligase
MLRSFVFGLGSLLFFSMLIIPATYQMERGAILMALCLAVLLNGIFDYWIVHRSIIIVLFLCVANSLVFMTLGVSNGAPGAVSVGTVYVAWPLIYVFLMGSLRNFESQINLVWVLVLGIIVASLLGFVLVADGLGLVSSGITQFFQSQGGSVGIYEGKIEYSLLNTSTVIYGFPFLFGLLALPHGTTGMSRSLRRVASVALFLCFISLIITGRRSLIVIGLLTPLITAVIYRLGGLASPVSFNALFKVVLAAIAIAICAGYFFDMDFLIIWDDFKSAFDFSDDTDRRTSSSRGEQYLALVDGWKNQLLFGHGHGSGVSSVVRDTDSPWAYELSYIALLYQIGVVGFCIYAVSLAWLFSRSLQVVRKNAIEAGLLLPLLIGLTGFLIANATNPYLLKFDYLWTIFFPVSVLNVLLLNANKASLSGYHI